MEQISDLKELFERLIINLYISRERKEREIKEEDIVETLRDI